MVNKSYLRYEPYACFGIVCSLKSNGVWVKGSSFNSTRNNGQCAACPALEDVIIWDVKRGEKVAVLKGQKYEVTSMALSPDQTVLAVGYEDGAVKLWKLQDRSCQVTLSGHRTAVSTLHYDQSGGLLVSGSKDTDVIVWDTVSESGLYRLKGHKGMITQCYFFKKAKVLLTSSKDSLVKFWDLDTQHCFLTLVGHSSEVWGFAVVKDETRIVTGCSDSDLKVWHITWEPQGEEEGDSEPGAKRKPRGENTEGGACDKENEISCVLAGSIFRQSCERVISVVTDNSGSIVGCLGNDSQLELYRIRTEEEITKHLKKKLKKQRKKIKEEGGELPVEQETRSVDDEITRFYCLKRLSKVKSFDLWHNESTGTLEVLLLLQNNTVEVHSVNLNQKPVDSTCNSLLTLAGHRSDIRTLSLSSDGTCILSGSHESVKVWNRLSRQCIRTMTTGYALSSFFVPGDRHAIVGNKAGNLEIYDVSSGDLLESVDAHSGPVWGLALAPDKRGFASASGDCSVKFWDFELVADANSSSSKRLSVSHAQTLQLKEEVLMIKYSANKRLLAISLLDCTVKIFFADTLKFFLSLYGHKLPVIAMDISSDSNLIVTGSADKNIKIWGLDFGDCHKSIFAHEDSIMAIQFVAQTHYFFSISKDKTVSYWDGDNFQKIMTLEGHHGEVWCLAVSPRGDFLVTGSHDRSLRLWERTYEPLFPEEEQELERERSHEASVAQEPEKTIPEELNTEAVKAGKKTTETVKAAERLMEALDLYREETSKQQEHSGDAAAKSSNPILVAAGNISPLRYVLEEVKKIRSSELEEALIVLPFDYVVEVLTLINQWLKADWEVELSCRCMSFLLRIHQNQIVANKVLLPVIDSLRHQSKYRVRQLRDKIGFNMAGLEFMQTELEAKEVSFFADATEKVKNIRKKQKVIRPSFK